MTAEFEEISEDDAAVVQSPFSVWDNCRVQFFQDAHIDEAHPLPAIQTDLGSPSWSP